MSAAASDPDLEHNDRFFFACKENNIELVDLFLNDPKIDPEFKSNRAIKNAIQFGHDQIVKLLLDSKKINPRVLRKLFVLACSYGHDNVVKVFLDFRKEFPFPPAVYDDEQDQEAMHLACFDGHTGVVRLLIEEGGIDPSIDRDMPIRTAIKLDQDDGRDNKNLIRLLLQYPNVNPSARSNEALDYIMRDGNIYTLRYLLEIDDPRINPYLPETFDFLLNTANEHQLFSEHFQHYRGKKNYFEIIKLLMNDARFVIPHFLYLAERNVTFRQQQRLLEQYRFVIPHFLYLKWKIGDRQRLNKLLEEYILSEKYVYSKKYDNVLHLLPHDAPVGGPFGTELPWGWGHSQFSLEAIAAAVGGPPTADLEYLARNKEKLALMGSYTILPNGNRLQPYDDRLATLVSIRGDSLIDSLILDYLAGKKRKSDKRKKRTCKKSKRLKLI
jgi:hypothetical protein